MNAKISQAILNEVNSGKTIQQAIDTVLGQGTYAQVASDVYVALKAK